MVEASTSHRYAEIGYCLRSADWGKGIATEALNGVLGFLFDIVGLHRVYLRHDTRNAASGRVMQKNGLVHEGTLRQHFRRKDGTFGDVAVYGILHGEWISRTTPDGKDL